MPAVAEPKAPDTVADNEPEILLTADVATPEILLTAFIVGVRPTVAAAATIPALWVGASLPVSAPILPRVF